MAMNKQYMELCAWAIECAARVSPEGDKSYGTITVFPASCFRAVSSASLARSSGKR